MYSERSKSDNRSAAVEIYYDYLGCKLEQRFLIWMFEEESSELSSLEVEIVFRLIVAKKEMVEEYHKEIKCGRISGERMTTA